MPYIVETTEVVADCAKRVVEKQGAKYVTPSKYSPSKHELAELTAKQLAAAAEEYPKEYDVEIGYIGKGAEEA